ncbi:tellurite resistance TerB family protein [Salinimonas iocasae]|uniref:ATPase n=1 Tax=Salinimonas iocasae TaxID=2572577 RepID=A0A5B7YFE3_9ALTE|nr:TerB N-terminal domain-containing protein [Salinimonas iocasae]QCZ94414.1 ATPase [Salinimonas iocasae]
MEFLIAAIVIYVLYKLISGTSSSNSSTNTYNKSNNASLRNKKQNDFSIKVTSSNDEYDDDDFATFTIRTSFGQEPEKSPNKTKGRWIKENEQLNINGRKVLRGFYYFGGVMDSLDGYGIEPSLVDEKRPASKSNSYLYTDDSLGYWPSYASLSKDCRGAYLSWLASDRSDPETPIGYVFIYFYGFERRVIEGRSKALVPDSEFTAIFNEVLRLQKIFDSNRSFKNYSSNFLELMALLRPTLLENRLDEIPETNNAMAFKVKLAETVVKGDPVNHNLSLEWLKDTYEYSMKTPARRCEGEFKQLFTLRFKEKFGEGINVKPNKTKLRLSYHPSSNGIHAVDLELDELPDPSILKGPIKKIIPIAEQCTEELSSYSRYLGKADTSKDDIAALMLLPRELANESNSPVIESFRAWAKGVIESHGGLATVKEFWSQTGMPLPKSCNKKENELLINLASKADIGIAPDQRFHHTKFKLDDKIVLFSPGHGEFFEPSAAFNQTSLAIRLGAMVATIDGTVDEHEKLTLQNLIGHDDNLSPSEKSSLNAYLIWRLNTPTNSTGLKARISTLLTDQVEYLKRFILSIALADGKIDSSEIKQIEKLYASLGLDKSLVSSDIHAFASTKRSVSNVSTRTTATKDTFSLDESVLAVHESDTQDAKSVLESIFAVDDEPEVEANVLSSESQNGLDIPHNKLFDMLIERESWSRKEIIELCANLNLMIDGALETINDWAYEKVDAPVLDDDGDIYVDTEIVEELKG